MKFKYDLMITRLVDELGGEIKWVRKEVIQTLYTFFTSDSPFISVPVVPFGVDMARVEVFNMDDRYKEFCLKIYVWEGDQFRKLTDRKLKYPDEVRKNKCLRYSDKHNEGRD